MSKYLSSVSRVALAAALLSISHGVAFADPTPIHTGETVDTTQSVSPGETLTIEQGGKLIVPDSTAISIGGGTGTVTIDNSGTINSTEAHTIDVTGNGSSPANPLKLIINNRATGVISNDNDSNRDVIRPSRNNYEVEINNWGTIIHNGIDEGTTSSGDAIDFQDRDAQQTVNNLGNGLIEGNRHGITGDTPVTVTNEGTIKGRNGSGINVDGGGVVVTNKSTGIIIGGYRGTGEGDGDAIDTDGDLILKNWGKIRGLDAGGFNDGEQNFAEGLAIGGGTIENFAGGEIYGKGNGILADDSGGGSTSIVTTIYNEGLIEASDYDAIRLVGDNDDEITNKGTIRAGKYGIAIDMGGGQDKLTLFTGSTVEGLIDGGLGQNTLNLNGAGTDTLHGTIINFQDLKVDGGRWTLEGTHNYTVIDIAKDATLVVEDGTGQLNVDPNGNINLFGRLEASGKLFQIYSTGGTLAVAGDKIGSLTIEDTLSLDGEWEYDTGLSKWVPVREAALEVTVDAQGHSDFLTVTNAAKEANLYLSSGVQDGIVYGPLLKVQALAGDYAAETKYHIIHLDGTINGDGFQDSITTNFAFLDASLSTVTDDSLGYETNDIFLTLARNDTQFWDVADTTNQKGVAKAIAAAGGSSLHNKIVTLGVDDAKAAFDSLSGESYASAMGAQVIQANLVSDTLQSRLGSGLAGTAGGSAIPAFQQPQYLGASEKDELPQYGGRLSSWLKGYGERLNLDSDGNAGALEGTVGGVLGGFDYVSKNAMLGIAGGYSQASTDVDSRRANADTDTFLVAAYGAYVVDRVKLSGGASYGWSSSDSEREALGDTLTASYDGNTTNVFGEIAYRAKTGATSFEPFAGFYVKVEQDAFTEKGGIGALASDGESFDSTASTLGLRVAYDIASVNGMRVTPRASLGWRHAFGDVTPSAALSFAETGASFTVDGTPIAENSAVVGAGVDVGVSESVTLGFDYTGSLAEEATSNAGRVIGRVEF